MKSFVRWQVLLPLALIVTAAVVVIRLVSLPQAGSATAIASLPADLVQTTIAADPKNTVSSRPEPPPSEETILRGPDVHNAEAFETYINAGMADGGDELIRAFEIHDSCSGVPRSQRGLDEWFADNASEPDVDYDLITRRTQECIGVPAFTFDTRRRMLLPLAKSGNKHAQFLLATSFPYALQSHRHWLQKSAEGGYAPAMVLLAQSLLEQSGVESARRDAHQWLMRASELGHPFATAERMALEGQMSLGELNLTRSTNAPSTPRGN